MTTTNDVAALECEVLELIRGVLTEYADVFGKFGLIHQTLELNRLRPDTMDYQSEVTVYFYDDGGVFDVIEFFVYRQGKPTGSKQEIEEWLRETINDVLERRKKHLENS